MASETRASACRFKHDIELAIRLWAGRLRHCLADQGALFTELLDQHDRVQFVGKTVLLMKIAGSLSEAAVSHRAADGRGPLPVSLRQSHNSHELQVAEALADRLPADAFGRILDDAVHDVPAHIWARLLHHRLQTERARSGRFPDALVSRFHRAQSERHWAEFVLERVVGLYGAGQADSACRFVQCLGPQRLLDACRGLFTYHFFNELDKVWCLAALYDRLQMRGAFLAQVPHMFGSIRASHATITFMIDKLFDSWPDRAGLWRLDVLERVLAFHLDRDLVFIAAPHDGPRFDLWIPRVLKCALDRLLNLTASDEIVALEALRALPQVRHRALRLFLVNLAIRSILSTGDEQIARMPLLVPDDVPRTLQIMATFPEWHHDFDRIRLSNPALYQQLVAVLPETGLRHPSSYTRTAPAPDPEPVRARAGADLIRDYEIVNVLGVGWNGTVYRARRRDGGGVQPEVAIKFPASTANDATNEIEFMSRFCHDRRIPGLVRLLDLVQYGGPGQIGLVMEIVPGVTLARWPPAPASVEEIGERLVWIVYQMLSALHRLHEYGWSHCSIRHLDNFMIDADDDDRLVVLDFGRAHRPDPAQYPNVCSDDLHQVCRQLTIQLDTIKQRFGVSWYLPVGDHLLDRYEGALRSWLDRGLSCVDLLQDAVFDRVRHRRATQ